MSGLLALPQAAVLLGGVAAWIVLTFVSERPPRTKAGAALTFGWLLLAGLTAMRAADGLGPFDMPFDAHVQFAAQDRALALMATISTAIAAGPLTVLLLPSWSIARRVAVAVAIAAAHLGLYGGYVWPWANVLVALPAVAIAAAAVPAHALAHWTEHERRVGARSALQTALWLAILLWLLPDLAMQQLGGTWQWPGLNTASFALGLVLATSLALIAAAIRQFAIEGHGTGLPWDPPKHLVRGGIYGHIRNPMQLGICLMLASWGALLTQPLVIGSGFVALLLFIAFRDVCSGVSNVAVAGSRDWQRYKANVPAWHLRLRPWRDPGL